MSVKVDDIRSISIEKLNKFVDKNNFPLYRSNQIFNWINKSSVKSFDDMTNLPKSLIDLLKENFRLNFSQISSKQISIDSTMKFAIKLHDKLVVESVLIPSGDRVTACVSSQVGCSLDCEFCATSKLLRMRNLESYEIFDQIILLNKQSIENYSLPISNIVFMGMGEPLLNYNNVINSINLITGKEGIEISNKKITLSTSGISKMIHKMADDNVQFNLAISLHSAIESTRNEIMPFTKSFPLNQLIKSLEYWYEKTKRKVTFEYLIWKGINDDFEHINALVKICKRVPSKVNLIEYNSIDDPRFSKADELWVNKYLNILKENKVSVSIRRSRGKDIQAACGQLANKH
ncbi:MAG: 23S rRNA (adenine(2503)-C(2))-methyltransferase RlmN [Flavobacteriaceae bacterium]|nr:23S rRNA (adenine(2503)-C(2))-methyltransferase RlmN [Flavobacteriaceae bacterium]MBL6684254.1 23S rRNA (adenine(2503)-C(2))-methyltransferase RlmN [Flavobacteriaceae bacterium]